MSLGALCTGTPWHRPDDLAGLGWAGGWISRAHAAHLGAGGVDGFIGDGGIQAASERVVEVFYSLNVAGPTWLSADYQRIVHPAFNADRGPVQVLGGRVHAGF